MFENLIESQDKSKKSIGQTVTSFYCARGRDRGGGQSDRRGAEAVKNVVTDTTMVFLKPPPPPPPPP